MTDDQSTVLNRIRTGLQTYVDMVHGMMTDGRLPVNEEQTKAAIISPFVRDVHTIECSGVSDGEGTDDIDTASESIPDPPVERHVLSVNPFLRFGTSMAKATE